MKILLASTSTFKNEILDKVGIKHDSASPTSEEYSTKENPYEYVKELSYNKANSLKDKSDIIIGLDTITLINNKIVEKPKSLKEAKDNVLNCSNNTVSVLTGYCIIDNLNNKIINDYQETFITFNEISKEEMEIYVNNDPDIMYVSGFTIEGMMSNFIKEIKGSYYNILGAPVEKLYEYLRTINYKF